MKSVVESSLRFNCSKTERLSPASQKEPPLLSLCFCVRDVEEIFTKTIGRSGGGGGGGAGGG